MKLDKITIIMLAAVFFTVLAIWGWAT